MGNSGIRLILRQLLDIQNQAERILNGDDTVESIIAFAKFMEELKIVVRSHIKEHTVQRLLAEIPEIKYSNLEYKWWHDIVFPVRWVFFLKQLRAKRKALEIILIAKSKLATIEFLIKSNEENDVWDVI